MKRFYKSVEISQQAPFEVLLDSRPIKTPLKKVLTIPTQELAQAIKKEWENVEETIEADLMPLTQLLSTAIDKVTGHESEIIEQILPYIHGDTLLYPTIDDTPLYNKQKKLWLPLIENMNKHVNTQYAIQETLIAKDQHEDITSFWKHFLQDLSPLALNAFQVSVSLTSSPILSYFFLKGELEHEKVFQLAFLEECHQNELWGQDFEAEKIQKKKQKELKDLAFYSQNIN